MYFASSSMFPKHDDVWGVFGYFHVYVIFLSSSVGHLVASGPHSKFHLDMGPWRGSQSPSSLTFDPQRLIWLEAKAPGRLLDCNGLGGGLAFAEAAAEAGGSRNAEKSSRRNLYIWEGSEYETMESDRVSGVRCEPQASIQGAEDAVPGSKPWTGHEGLQWLYWDFE